MNVLERFALLPWDIRFLIMRLVPGTFFKVCRHYRELLQDEIQEKMRTSPLLCRHPTQLEICSSLDEYLHENDKISFVNKKTRILHTFHIEGKKIYYTTQGHNDLHRTRTIPYRGVNKKHCRETFTILVKDFTEKHYENIFCPANLLRVALQHRPAKYNIELELRAYIDRLPYYQYIEFDENPRYLNSLSFYLGFIRKISLSFKGEKPIIKW